MILYVNGCSHTYGDDAGGPQFAFGKHIADDLNYSYVNHATPGCSNDFIIQQTYEYIKYNKTDFIIIGWTTWERETWIYEGKTFHVNNSGLNLFPGPPDDYKYPAELVERHKDYVINSYDLVRMVHTWFKNYLQIYDLHCKLKEKNIKHLFFNTYSSFANLVKFCNYREILLYQWNPEFCYFSPYKDEDTYYNWLVNKGFKPFPKNLHHGPEAHKEWANFLLPKVKHLISNT